jgi:hypothetical protein
MKNIEIPDAGAGPFAYSAFGALIRSCLLLPELEECSGTEFDVVIIWGSVDTLDAATESPTGYFHWKNADEFYLEVPDVARFAVISGRQIVIDAVSALDFATLRLFLLGSVFGALLMQRKMLLLHGNAIGLGGESIVCIGNSGAGKSTLAAAFAERGHAMLADDLAAIDAQFHIVPGVPRVKLCRDAVERLGMKVAGMIQVAPCVEKYSLPLKSEFGLSALPLLKVYELVSSDTVADVVLTPLRGLDRFACLLANSYRYLYIGDSVTRRGHLDSCLALMARAEIVRVTRPRQGCSLDALVEALLLDVSEARKLG